MLHSMPAFSFEVASSGRRSSTLFSTKSDFEIFSVKRFILKISFLGPESTIMRSLTKGVYCLSLLEYMSFSIPVAKAIILVSVNFVYFSSKSVFCLLRIEKKLARALFLEGCLRSGSFEVSTLASFLEEDSLSCCLQASLTLFV